MFCYVKLSIALVKELTVEIHILSDELEIFHIKEKFEFHECNVLILYLSEKFSSHIVDKVDIFAFFNCCIPDFIFITNDFLIID